MSTFPTDIEIAQNASLSHIKEIAKKINISEDDLEYYGKHKAKLPLNLQKENPKGKLILVSACHQRHQVERVRKQQPRKDQV